MNLFVSVLSIATAVTIGAMSPGPSFVMVARTSVATSRAAGLAAALGMGVGGVLFAILALTGLQMLLTAVPWFYVWLKIVGGAYLIYLGVRIWLHAKAPLNVAANVATDSESVLMRPFLLALGTQVSNPKAAVIYGSIFAALLPPNFSVWFSVLIVLIVFTIETGWYAVVAWVLSSNSPRKTYLTYKAWLDRVAGSVMMLLGLRLIASSR